ncbi:hypothetical protein ARC78_14615 [Stenotrophomonas pictorum JCM 9942]|uniref:HTH marR-type domain-containing protein n=1 Tax=Stenotrophomonas pictorum JCM 9942 TaxID=1236960 RepID=A0A0R0AED8_9GAMM|nr:winged helix-turn-helix domain-containing protein [Stenotrophomonas pictorum]KRG39304.1 hypothetical protein ARC78_14615 [Stenotrophomonas pictorum JCM 9942]
MSRSTATLQLASLDDYHQQLVRMLLQILEPRLHHRWQTLAGGDADAYLVDTGCSAGQQQLGQLLAGQRGGCVITLGEDTTTGVFWQLPKPLRLNGLLTALNAFSSQAPVTPAVVAPAVAAGSCRYRLIEWPALERGMDHPDELRLLSVLSRRALSCAEIANMLDLSASRVTAIVQRLDADGLLSREAATPVITAVPATPPPRDRGLISLLRRRFGL